MTGPDDTIPPSGAPATIPPPPPSESDVVIPKGQARAAVLHVLGELAVAIGHTEQIMQAMARALDAST